MKVTLMGPDDSGHWFLCDDRGNSWQIVQSYNDYAPAAQLLGWEPVGAGDELAQTALDFLLDHIGEDFNVPQHVADHFSELQQDADQ